ATPWRPVAPARCTRKSFTELGACVAFALLRSWITKNVLTSPKATPPLTSASPTKSRYHGRSITMTPGFVAIGGVAGPGAGGGGTAGGCAIDGGAVGGTGTGSGGGSGTTDLPHRSMPAAAFFASAAGGLSARNLRYASTARSQSPAIRRDMARSKSRNFD